jgi:hypothetical protein
MGPTRTATWCRCRSRIGHLFHAQQRVGKHFLQADFQLAFLGARQRGEIHPQHFGQLDQQAGGDVALVVLDQVQIAGTDTKPLSQGLLGKPLFRAQAPHGTANQRASHFYNLYDFTLGFVGKLTGKSPGRGAERYLLSAPGSISRPDFGV